jgi:hypothetical protein
MQFSKLNKKRILFILLVVSMMVFATQPFAASAQTFAGATSQNGGAAFANAQAVGGIASTTAASIGNASAFGLAFTPVSSAGAAVATNGPAAAYAQGFSMPGFSQSNVWVGTLPGGSATGSAFGNP